MRSQKKIIIDIDEEGHCSIDGEGFVGPSCSYFISEIEESLGKSISSKNKPEYKQRQTSTRRNLQKGGR